jgi:2-phosphosulfolactate phosphatase
MKQKINVCLSLSLIDLFDFKDSIVVVIDVLRATTAICEAFKNGASKIIPVADLNIAKQYKKDGYIVAAERDGNVLDFADFGNSPHNFTKDRLKTKLLFIALLMEFLHCSK